MKWLWPSGSCILDADADTCGVQDTASQFEKQAAKLEESYKKLILMAQCVDLCWEGLV